jgi:hypothetical protein
MEIVVQLPVAEAKKVVKNQHHVVPSAKGGWDVKRAQTGRSITHCSTKKDAISQARKICGKHGTTLVVHNSNGRFAKNY